MTWEEIIRRYPHQWVIFEVERPAVPAARGVLLRVLEAGCPPQTILKRFDTPTAKASGILAST